MPVKKIAESLKKVAELRNRAKLPANVDRRIVDSLSAIKKLPQMPLKERQAEAKKQRDALADVRVAIGDILNQATYSIPSTLPGPDIVAALDATIDALGTVAEGAADVAGDVAGALADAAGSIDFNV